MRAVDLDDRRASSEPLVGRLRVPGGRRDDVRFAWSGDIVGQGWGIDEQYGGFRAANALLDLDPDFFLCSGDTVYSDGPLVPTVALPDGGTYRNVVTEAKSAVAQTLDQYRGQFAYNLLADNWRAFLARTPQVNQWDDHEVRNNWYPGQLLDDPRYQETDVDVLARRARRAWGEYVPTSPSVADPHGRIYRVVHLGPLVDLFVLDMRTHKNPNGPDDEMPGEGVLGDAQVAWLEREPEAVEGGVEGHRERPAPRPRGAGRRGEPGGPRPGRRRCTARPRGRGGAHPVVPAAPRDPQPRVAHRRRALHRGAPLRPEPGEPTSASTRSGSSSPDR
ncbi:hypothetical protein GCM10025868_01530 [Angustibacter aerolatus]|uniref:PhoD-like phosphatase metallophosphatase domain-containing protein n=1 Tax=Angustibacter aerolatus TaxID=1162965 RepID=A0ABQ6JBR7_9ACTN|nr:alkaline phosphatase D family protein [Angustibacter aerolatus]GMA84903.1 hypothetical protein GCM10025868_01530 [Angustibacter aerolatus]